MFFNDTIPENMIKELTNFEILTPKYNVRDALFL